MLTGKQFLAFGLAFSIDYGTSKGLGKHDVDIPTSDLPALYQSEYAFTILYNPALMATKTSILIFYLRMSRNTQNILRIASYITLGIVNIAGIVLTFLNAFRCHPAMAAYTPNINGTCTSIVTLFLCSAPVNIVTDLAILVLPIPVLTGMRLPQRQKTVLVFTFALGIFVTIVDVVRIYYLQQASDLVDNQITPTSTTQVGSGPDFYWNTSRALMWSAVEVNVGIICACIPTLKPLIKRILPSMITDRSKTGTNKTAYASELNTSDETQRPSATTGPPNIQPLPPVQLHGDQEQEMGMMDFLTTPGMDQAEVENRAARTQTRQTNATENAVYFGFIDMKVPKSMLNTRGIECFKYCTTVTILFFLWGFSYGLLNILNNQIADIAHQNRAQTISLSSAYFGGYLFGPLTVGGITLRRGGFKATFICGLCIYGTGTIMFWPSAVLASFPGFIICQFVVGFGLSVLETAANPFLALCGPSQYAEFRLLLAQGVQGIGTVLSQLLAQKVLFNNLKQQSLIDVQWTYLAITLFTAILALFFYYMPLPEVSDTDLQQQAKSLSIFPSQTIGTTRLPLIYTTLALAIFAQFTYVAAQECHSIWFAGNKSLLAQLTPNTSDLTLSMNDYGVVGHTTFTAGRFLFAPLCLIMPPRILLLISIILSTLFAILTMSLHLSANGIAGPALVFFFFEGPAFPLIFAIGLRGMGRWTKWAASGLTAACSGGAVFPFVMYAVQRVDGKTVQYSYCVIIALMAFGGIFPAYLCLVPGARHQVDPARPATVGDGVVDDRPETPGSRFGRRVSAVFQKIGVGKTDGELPVVEHRERDWGMSLEIEK
jgi:fucose permease